MSNHDAAWEASLRPYMRNQRLLVAKNIHFREAKAEFEVACRAALRKPDSVTFFWRDADVAGRKHRGQAMLAFANRPDCRDALEDLRGLIVRGRSVNVVKGSKHAVSHRYFSSTSYSDRTIVWPAAGTTACHQHHGPRSFYKLCRSHRGRSRRRHLYSCSGIARARARARASIHNPGGCRHGEPHRGSPRPGSP